MPPSTHSKPVSSSARAAGIAYIALAALFALGTVALVFLAGLGVLVDPSRFAVHRSFAHFIELLPLLMVFAALLARLPQKLLGLTVLLLLLFGAQYVFLYLMPMLGLTPLRALHAVNALAMFWLGLKRVIARPGQTVVVPPRAVHYFANAGKETAQVRVEVRPALRMEQLLEVSTALAQEGRTFLGGLPKPLDMAIFLREFRRESQVPLLPPKVVEFLTAPLASLAHAQGLDRRYRGSYNLEPRLVRRLSVSELFGPHFLLLAGADGQPWLEAAKRVEQRLELKLSAHCLPAEGELAETHGLSPTGAVLVRPDGGVGWQAETLVHDPERALTEAVLRLANQRAA